MPAENETCEESGDEVQGRIDGTGAQAGPEPVPELVGGVLETERQQEQKHADLGDERDEVVADVERYEPAFADREPGEEIQRYGGEAEPARYPRQHGEREGDGADLEERGGRVRARGGDDHEPSSVRRSSSP